MHKNICGYEYIIVKKIRQHKNTISYVNKFALPLHVVFLFICDIDFANPLFIGIYKKERMIFNRNHPFKKHELL